MKKFKFLISLALVVISLFTICTSNVQAAGLSKNIDLVEAQALYQRMVQAKNQGIDIDTFFATLSPKEQKIAIKILTPTSVEIEKNNPLTSPIILLDTGTILTTTMNLNNIYGMTICQYAQQITWYYDGTYITQPPQCTRVGVTFIYGWTYNGVTSQGEWGGQGYTYYRAYSQGNFTLKLGGWIVQSWYPIIDQTVYGNGTYSVYTYP